MKKFLFVIGVFILGVFLNLYFTKPKVVEEKKNFVEEIVEEEFSPKKEETLDDARNSITSEELKEMLTTISSDEFSGRKPGSEGWNKTRDFIQKEYQSYGLETQLQHFNVGRISTENIIGIFKGHEKSDEYVVIGAHADHLGKRGNAIFHGSDDNGSGTVAILEVAEGLGKIKDKLKRNVVFISFSCEEMGLLGSKYYVDHPIYDLKKTVAMVNLDMVGYLNGNSLSCIGAGKNPKLSNFCRKLDENYPFSVNISNNVGGGSDHASFARAGVPIVFLHTGLHRNYHKPSDTIEKIDFNGLTEISRFTLDLVWKISQDF